MGLFDKKPKVRRGLFGISNHSEVKDRVKWATDRYGDAANAVESYKSMGQYSASTDDVRRELARRDDYLRLVVIEDVERALD